MVCKVIGLSGRARVGKSTAAELLVRLTGGYPYSFADPIRRMLAAGFGIDMNEPQWQDRKEDVIPELGHSPRYLMQTLGTEWGRDWVHPEVWIIRAQAELAARGPGMIVGDVRFENEAHWIRNVGGMVIHLERAAAPAVRAHASEAGIRPWPDDRLIQNDGSVDDLALALMQAVRDGRG